MKAASEPVLYHHAQAGQIKAMDGDVIAETPVSMTVNGEAWLTLMCTPVDLEALAIGFLFNEGVIQSREEVASVRVCQTGDNVDVWLNHSVEKPQSWRRTSGCTGGVTSVEEGPFPSAYPSVSPSNGYTLPLEAIARLMAQLFEAQDLYRSVGGVHTSALSDGQEILVVAEDIGRHNTLDKIAGFCLLNKIQPHVRILLTTGRISSEMLQKASRIGAIIVISRTSPTSLSIQMAQQLGITLIGYARRDRFNIYSHPESIRQPVFNDPSPTIHSPSD